MISVIIPLYNKEEFVGKAIQSVFDQEYTNWELIIVNDGSTDNSIEIVQQKSEYCKKEITIINQTNQGVSAARNNGVKSAKNQFIAFLDADDWWSPKFLNNMSKLILDFPDAGIYGSAYYWIKNGRSTVSKNDLKDNFRGYFNYVKTYQSHWWMPLTSISVVIPKHVYKEFNGFKENLKYGEDFDLWIRIALKYKTAYINKPLAYYNQDINCNNRAIGSKRIYLKENSFIFNLSYLDKHIKSDNDLKLLIDRLKAQTLYKYRLAGVYRNEVKQLLSNIDWGKIPSRLKRKFFFPISLIKTNQIIRDILSKIKSRLLYR